MFGVLLAFVIAFVLLASVGAVVLVSGPGVWAAQERERIDREARFAQWRLQQATSAALQRLLDEARHEL